MLKNKNMQDNLNFNVLQNAIIATFNVTSGENLLETNKENVKQQTEETSLTKKEFFDNLPSLVIY